MSIAHTYILPTVRCDGKTCSCAACGHDLGPASAAWKSSAARRELPLIKAGGPAYDTGYDSVVLRQFMCPGCAALLDTETAIPGDPALEDRLGKRP